MNDVSKMMMRALACGAWLILALGVASWAEAADAETRAFNNAAKALQDHFAPRAEREFADFIQKFSESSRVAEAILGQARAVFEQTNLNRAVELLTDNLPRAGQLADEYRFWLGQMRLESGQYAAAAAEFARLLAEYPASSRRLEASYKQAQAHFKLEDWKRVVELLRKPDGAFQQASQMGGDPDLTALGQLLLAEALFRQQDYAAAEAAARRVPTNSVAVAWSRQYLLCRVSLAAGREQEALASTTNLLELANTSTQPLMQAESYTLQGAILEQLKQYEAAMAAYEKVQAEKMPEAQRRDAFLRTVELNLAQNNLSAASARLERFLAAHPEDSASDDALLTRAELRLKEHLLSQSVTNPPATNELSAAVTNRVQQALLLFDQLIQEYPQSPHLGKAQLGRGWALLAAGKIVESQAAFKQAAEKLPVGDDQAVARFKLADTQFLQDDLTNALAGYRKIIEDYGGLPRVRTGLFNRAWYQIARLSMKSGDWDGASNAVRTILVLFPSSLYAEQILLQFGQALNQTNRAAEARGLFAEFNRQFTNSALLPEVEMAIARSYELESNWTAAIPVYERLLKRFGTNEIAARAAFWRAFACAQAGQETNALNLLTNFVARFPTNEYAPRAQDWIGDFYFRNTDFAEAERNYQRLYQNTNWPAGDPIMFEAKFKAGRAALMRQSFGDATNYFITLINDKQCPTNLLAETLFAYGDVLISQPGSSEVTNSLAVFERAIVLFDKIPQLCAKDPVSAPLIARAWGRIANCYFQLGKEDPRRYTNAIDYYEKALAAPQADLATRSQAEVGLGHVLVKQAQLKAAPDPLLLNLALEHYLNVIYGKRLLDGEASLPLWVKEAGFAAARILEAQKRWTQVIALYGRLQQIIPPLRPTLEKRVAFAREQLGAKQD